VNGVARHVMGFPARPGGGGGCRRRTRPAPGSGGHRRGSGCWQRPGRPRTPPPERRAASGRGRTWFRCGSAGTCIRLPRQDPLGEGRTRLARRKESTTILAAVNSPEWPNEKGRPRRPGGGPRGRRSRPSWSSWG
jgi:hypothetical protein